MTQKDYIAQTLKYMEDNKAVDLWNEYQDRNGYEERIYPLCELDDFLCNSTPLEILESCTDIDTNDNYFYYTIYGYQSFNELDDCYSPINYEDLADFVQGHGLDWRDVDDDEAQEELITYAIDDVAEIDEDEREAFRTYCEDNVSDYITEDWDDIIQEYKDSKEDED